MYIRACIYAYIHTYKLEVQTERQRDRETERQREREREAIVLRVCGVCVHGEWFLHPKPETLDP